MRRTLALLSAVAFLSASASTVSGQEAMIGFKGGLNFANVDATDAELGDTQSDTGLIGGAFLEIGLGDVIVLQPELLLSQKGFEVEEAGAEASAELTYVEIPLLLKAVLGADGSVVRPAIYAGPAISIEASCGVELEADGMSESFDCEDPEAELDRDGSDLGLVFGAELQFDVGSFVLLVDGRYNLGLRNLAVDADAPADVKTRTWSLMAGIGFPLN